MHQRISPLSGSIRATNTYRPDIDGLRAVAVLSVFAFHAFPEVTFGGFIGVDIFFVISGYLISSHIFAAHQTGTFSLADFYARRIRRIFPALIVVLVASLIAGWFILLTDEYDQLGKNAAAGAAFISNLVMRTQGGYFEAAALTRPLLHLWSLGVEEQFYIVWPLITLVLWRTKANTLLWISLIAGASFALNVYQVQSNQMLAFHSPLTRFWELLVGAMLAQIQATRRTPLTAQHQQGLSLTGAGLIVIGLVVVKEADFPGWWATLPVAGTAMMIAAGPKPLANKAISGPAFVAIGLISYPLYLWHWPLLSFARIVEGDTPAISIRVAIVVAAVALSAMTYLLVERPLRFGINRRKVVAWLIIAMAAVCAIGLLIHYKKGLPNRPGVEQTLKFSAQFEGGLWPFTKNETCTSRYPFSDAEQYVWWFCSMNRNADPEILVLGNSFANQLYPGLAENADIGRRTVLSIGTCPPYVADPVNTDAVGRSPCGGNNAYRQQTFIDDLIARSPTIRLVIIDGVDPKPTTDQIDRLKRRIDTIESHGPQVVVFVPHLRMKGDIRKCVPRLFNREDPQKLCDIDPNAPKQAMDDFAETIRSIEASNPNVRFFDQNKLYCKNNRCSFIQDGIPLVRDENAHISRYGSKKLAEIFAEWARTNIPPFKK